MVYYVLSVVIGMILLLLFVSLRAKGPGRAETAVKSLVSVFFLFTLFTAALAEGEHGVFAVLVGGGLLFGLLGDIWLNLRCVYPQDQDFWTRLGFGVFFVGHLFYVAAVVSTAGIRWQAVLAGVIAAAAAALFVAAGEKPLKMHYGSFRGLSAGYGALLFFMTVFALANAFLTRNTGLLIMGIGGVVFVLSDLILSGTYFGEGKDGPACIVSNYLLYYIAQYLIASAVLWAGRTF